MAKKNMRKKVLWDRVHRLEKDIEALMKIDDFVTTKMSGIFDQPQGDIMDPSMVPEHPDEDEKTVKGKSSNHSKSVTTLHPPPSQRGVATANKCKQNRKYHSAEPTPKDRSELMDINQQSLSAPTTMPSTIQRRGRGGSGRKKMINHPKYMRPVYHRRHNKANSPFTTCKSDANSMSTRSQQEDLDMSEGVQFEPVMEYSDQALFSDGEYRPDYQAHGHHGNANLEAKYDKVLERLSIERRRRGDAEQTLRVLRDRLEQNANALRDANRARAAALSVATQLRDKYETLRVARHQALEHLQTLKAENVSLSEQLAGEAARRRALAVRLETAEEAVGGRESARLCEMLEEGRRGREVLRAEAAAEAARASELRRRVREQEEEVDAARRRREELEEVLTIERRRRRSVDDPELQPLLEQVTRELRDRLMVESRLRAEAQEVCRAQQRRLHEAEAEAKGAATAAAAAAAAAANEAAAAAARERDRDLDRERKDAERVASGGVSSAAANELREVLAAEARRHAEELQRHADEAKHLHARCDELERKLRDQQADEDRRFRMAEEQWMRTRTGMLEKEQLMQRERQELEQLTVELTEALRVQRERTREFQQAHQRHEGLLRTQQQALQSKDEQMRLAHSETQALRERNAQLHEQLQTLQAQAQAAHRANEDLVLRLSGSGTSSGTALATVSTTTPSAVTANEHTSKITNKTTTSPIAMSKLAPSTLLLPPAMVSSVHGAVCDSAVVSSGFVAAAGDRRCERCESTRRLATLAEAELQKLQTALETAHDNLRIKDKVIEDQGDSIRQLKEQRREDLSAAAHERQKLQGALAQERRQAQKLRSELAMARRRCQQLQERCERLAEEVAGSGAEEQQRLLEQLEAEVREQRQLWERQMQKLTEEKDQALQAAELSAKRLQETMEEFQHQVASHRKVQSMLTMHLSRKEKELAEAHATVRLLNCPDGHSFGCWPPQEPPPSHKSVTGLDPASSSSSSSTSSFAALPFSLRPSIPPVVNQSGFMRFMFFHFLFSWYSSHSLPSDIFFSTIFSSASCLP